MAVLDPLDAATQAGERSSERFGQAHVEGRFVTLVKGQGKREFNPQSDSLDIRRTEVTIRVDPIEESGLTFFDKREIIAESSEWNRIVWASLRDLGVESVRELEGKWVRYSLAETGRSYTNRNGNEVKNTTFKFLELYPDKASCVTAFKNGSADNHSTNGNGTVAVDNTERATALAFLEALKKQHGPGTPALAQAIANMPMINKYFTIDSPEAKV